MYATVNLQQNKQSCFFFITVLSLEGCPTLPASMQATTCLPHLGSWYIVCHTRRSRARYLASRKSWDCVVENQLFTWQFFPIVKKCPTLSSWQIRTTSFQRSPFRLLVFHVPLNRCQQKFLKKLYSCDGDSIWPVPKSWTHFSSVKKCPTLTIWQIRTASFQRAPFRLPVVHVPLNRCQQKFLEKLHPCGGDSIWPVPKSWTFLFFCTAEKTKNSFLCSKGWLWDIDLKPKNMEFLGDLPLLYGRQCLSARKNKKVGFVTFTGREDFCPIPGQQPRVCPTWASDTMCSIRAEIMSACFLVDKAGTASWSTNKGKEKYITKICFFSEKRHAVSRPMREIST